jgi:hypothetical protein
MTRFERVLLYIGAPKTGTTSVQTFLWTSRSALMKQGFYIPATGLRGSGQHLELPATLPTTRRRNGLDRHAELQDGEIQSRRRDFLRNLDRELSTVSQCHTALLFSEHMFSSNRDEIRAYREVFASYAPHFESLMYLRRQDQWLASLTLQARKSGARRGVDLNQGSPERYGGNVRAWDAESDRCDIRRFDREFLLRGNLFEDFCDAIGADTSVLDIAEFRANPSIFQEQLELVDTLNEQLAPMSFTRQLFYRGRFISLCVGALGGAAVEFQRDTAIAVFESFRRINGWLRETRDPQGPTHFFTADFSGYQDDPKNDRRYSVEQLHHLMSIISGLRHDRGLPTSFESHDWSRGELIDRIVADFISLHEGDLDQGGEAAAAARLAVG